MTHGDLRSDLRETRKLANRGAATLLAVLVLAAGMIPVTNPVRAAGTVVVWPDYDIYRAPPGLSNVVAIAAGAGYSLALVGTAGASCVAPSVVTQPQSQTNVVGSTVIFAITVSGTVPLAYQWRFNNANLAEANSRNLTIPNLQLANAGQYCVVVTNAWGAVTSQVAVLTVWAPPAIATTTLPQAWFRSTYNQTLAATSGLPPIPGRWWSPTGSPPTGGRCFPAPCRPD